MTLVDTSIWVEHLRAGDATLARLLEERMVVSHPWVAGELALGTLRRRGEVLRLLRDLAQAVEATPDEVLTLVERHGLAGTGLGYVDAQLLASTRLMPGTTLWSRDRALVAASARLGVGFAG